MSGRGRSSAHLRQRAILLLAAAEELSCPLAVRKYHHRGAPPHRQSSTSGSEPRQGVPTTAEGVLTWVQVPLSLVRGRIMRVTRLDACGF